MTEDSKLDGENQASLNCSTLDGYGGEIGIRVTCDYGTVSDARHPELHIRLSFTGQYTTEAEANTLTIKAWGGETAALPDALRQAARFAEVLLKKAHAR